MKLAVMFLFPLMVTLRGLVLPPASPLQLMKEYPGDLEPDLQDEITQLRAYLQDSPHVQQIPALYQMICQHGITSTFPNVHIALRIYLSIMCSNCEGERAFSKLKLIKNFLRSTMLQDKLSDLALLSIENEITRKLTFDEIIDDFARMKSRKMCIK